MLDALLAYIQEKHIQRLEYEKEVNNTELAISVAGIDKALLVRTIVFQNRDSNRIIATVIPAGSRVDKKILSRAGEGGGKSWRYADKSNIIEICGYPLGGIPPLQLKENVTKIYVDPRVLKRSEIVAAGGTPYSLIRFDPQLILEDARIEIKIICYG